MRLEKVELRDNTYRCDNNFEFDTRIIGNWSTVLFYNNDNNQKYTVDKCRYGHVATAVVDTCNCQLPYLPRLSDRLDECLLKDFKPQLHRYHCSNDTVNKPQDDCIEPCVTVSYDETFGYSTLRLEDALRSVGEDQINDKIMDHHLNTVALITSRSPISQFPLRQVS